jgi:hypothetical protein
MFESQCPAAASKCKSRLGALAILQPTKKPALFLAGGATLPE